MRDVRKTVTILFADVVASTELGEHLDPEALRRVVSRYFDEMAAVLESYGGTVEKFIGDEVMAVFGVPFVHEDDALRAVRAAAAMHWRLAELNEELDETRGARLRIRIGINTGEVVAGDPSAGHGFVTGSAVNVAKRLEQAAEPGEILLGDATHRLVRHAVETTPIGPISLRGKRDPEAPQRVDEVDRDSEAVERNLDAPFVGRALELAQLQEAFLQVERERDCRLMTVLGPAGIGKSRLVVEFFRTLGDGAQVLRGRCLPYGEGITFWPLRQIVREATGGADPAVVLDEAGDGALVAERIGGLLGTSDARSGTQEAFWAVRRFLETLARERPLVVCIEDLHWAEPTLLDLVEYLAGWTSDAPVLLLCLARPELAELQPVWLVPKPNATVITLEPLPEQDARALIEAARGGAPLADDAFARIIDVSDGNPLFAEQLTAMLVEEGPSAAASFPPSIQALLAARLDRLPRPERAVLERAAVAGREFRRDALVELSPSGDREAVGTHLMALVRKELVSPDTSVLAGEDGFRFRHALIRDAAYEGMSKELRAELHERFATWVEQTAGGDEGGLDEVVGYHLEQAFRLREQLGPLDERTRELAQRAGGLLGAAGRRAFARDDMPAALSLFDRALALVTAEEPARLDLARELSGALWAVGELARAEALLDGVIETASAVGDRQQEWLGVLERAQRSAVLEHSAGAPQLEEVARSALAVFEELGDDAGLARAWRSLAQVARRQCRFENAQAHSERALGHARRAGASREEARIVDALCTALLYGPAPVEQALSRSEVLLHESRANRLAGASVLSSRAGLLAMGDAFAEAREALATARGVYEDLGLLLPLAGVTSIAGEIELLAGDARAAERTLREGYDFFRAHGALAFAAAQGALLARALAALGRNDEALAVAEEAEGDAPPDDLLTQVQVRGVRAALLAAAGDAGAALPLAEEAVALSARTDSLTLRAHAHLASADVHRRLGSAESGEAARSEAIRLLEQKGNVVAARDAAAALPARSA